MATFVLVHGAWHGGWCWRAVADRLRADGHLVYTPTLSGLTDRSHLISREINLTTHILDTANLIEWEELEDVVLCGHSYGGMVITGAADRVADRIRSLVYLDAFVPENGHSLNDYAPEHRRKQMLDDARERGEGWKVPPLPASAWVTDPAQEAWLNKKVTPHPIDCFFEPLKLTGALDDIGGRMYILAGANAGSAFHGFHDRLKDDPTWECRVIDGPHDLMLTHPAETTALLLDAAA